MSMTENNRINLANRERKWIAVAFLVFRTALNQSAFEQDFVSAGIQQIKGPGNLARRAVKLQIESHRISPKRLFRTCPIYLESRPCCG